MNKIAYGSDIEKGVIDLDYDFSKNIKNLADFKNKKFENITICILDRPRHKEINEEAKKLKADSISSAIELHFNAATPKATGHEWLYWHTSEKGRLFARALRDSFEDCFPQLRSRGIKAKQKGSRGAGFLRLTHCPATIAEPFFGSNNEDWELALKNMEGIATSIAGGIELYKELSERW